jgi:hypothetical protein
MCRSLHLLHTIGKATGQSDRPDFFSRVTGHTPHASKVAASYGATSEGLRNARGSQPLWITLDLPFVHSTACLASRSTHNSTHKQVVAHALARTFFLLLLLDQGLMQT